MCMQITRLSNITTQTSKLSQFSLSFHYYAGNPPGYQFTHFSGQATTAFTSDLPHLTGEDLKMLDAFSEQVREEEGQFVQVHSQQATLNYNGAGMMLQ